MCSSSISSIVHRRAARLTLLAVGLAAFSLCASIAGADPYVASLRARETELQQRRSTVGGVLPLLGLLDLWGRVSPAAVERVIGLTQQRKAHPLVEGYGLLLAARAARRRGKDAEAAASLRRAGVIPHWMICGPFDNPGKRGYAEALAPEKDLGAWPDPSKRYTGKEQQVQWRRVPGELVEGSLPVASLIDPSRDGVVYLQALLATTKDQLIALRLGTGGAFRVFLNGEEVGAREAYRPARPDQDTVALSLRRGTNRLVIKEAVAEGSWEVYARLTRADGGPLAEGQVRALERVPDEAPLGAPPRRRGRGVKPPKLDDLGSYLSARLKEKPEDAARLRDVALYHVRVAPTDSVTREAERAVQAWIDKAPTATGYLLLARVARDHNAEREAVERAVALDAQNAWAKLRLAGLRLRDRRTLDGQALLQQLLRAVPDFYPAAQRLAELQRSAGLERSATAQLDALLARFPAAQRLTLVRADLAQSQNDVERAEQLYRRYLVENADDLAARRALADVALRRGDATAALVQQDAAIRLFPHYLFLRLDRARLLAGMGKIDEAVAECQRALVIDPRSTRTFEELGRLQLRAGRRAAAWEAWRKALALRPQNAELRAYLSFLDPSRRKGLAERQRLDPGKVLASARPRANEDEPLTVLLELNATEVHPSGLSRTLHQRIARVENSAGAKRLETYVIRFDPDRQTVEIKAARVHKATGGVVEAASQREVPLNEPWAKLWYDVRARVLDFTGVQPGDTVEIEYVIEDVATDNMFADYFGDVAFVQEDAPLQRFEYVLITPRQRAFYFRQPKLRAVRHSATVEGEHRIYRWSARDVPKVVAEPGIPGWSEVADYLHVSTYQRWEDVARWYWGLVREQLKSTRAITETARKVTAKATTEMEKIRAIHGYVAKKTRYIGLEFGIHGYKPYSVDQVLARKFGDCKDKASLLVALLGEVGIDATLVAVRTRNRGALDATPASLAAFNHAIAYIPKHKIYLDGTAEFSGTGELPWQDQGTIALHIDRGGGGLRTTPILPASNNITRRTARWSLAADGQGKVSEEIRVAGDAASSWRSHYQVADQRRQSYEKGWNAAVGGAKVLKLDMRDLDDLERPVTATAELQVQSLARQDGAGKLSLALGGRELGGVGSLARLSTRRQPLGLEYAWRLEEQLRIVPPSGWRVTVSPTTAKISSPFGTFSRQVRQQGAELEVTQVLQLDRVRVEPADYPAFRAFVLRIDRLISERVVLAR
jgi:cellulose synthase operon protein C